ncbi:MAG TPA: hypothetical protein VNV43_06455 [Candidatus Acidoferrales bacterium]|nr:hypothetical protein [Candidatus Acidoferrales bacterium]
MSLSELPMVIEPRAEKKIGRLFVPEAQPEISQTRSVWDRA